MSLKLTLYRQKEKLKQSLYRARNGYCTVLLYHRIVDLVYDPQGLCVSPDNFHDQLSVLKKNHAFITIEEFTHLLSQKKAFTKNALLISFDDGYADNYHTALPILESLNLEAVFYIATKNLDTDNLFWWDELDLIFKQVKEAGRDVAALISMHNLKNADDLY